MPRGPIYYCSNEWTIVPSSTTTIAPMPRTRLTAAEVEAQQIRAAMEAVQAQLEEQERLKRNREVMKSWGKTFSDLRSLWVHILENPTDNYGDLATLIKYLARRKQALMERGNDPTRDWGLSDSIVDDVRFQVSRKLFRRLNVNYEPNYHDSFGLIHPDDVYHHDGEAMRREDFEAHYSSCCCCAGIFSNDTLVTVDNGDLYCGTCLSNEGYVYCDSCGEYRNDCETCEESECSARREQAAGRLFPYSADVTRERHSFLSLESEKKAIEAKGGRPGKNLYFGVELEVLPRKNVNPSMAIEATTAALGKYAIAKPDSSLSDGGFELVTVPATLEFHRRELWNKFFGDNGNTTEAQPYNKNSPAHKVRSWNTGCCGLHVHFSREATSPLQLGKFLTFMHEPENNDFLTRLAGRPISQSSRWCWARKKQLNANLVGICKWAIVTNPVTGKLENRLVITEPRHGDHYEAAAISGHTRGRTVEVRIFRGNASRHGVMRALDFVAALIQFCAQASPQVTRIRDENGRFAGRSNGLGYEAFLDWFNQPDHRGAYPDLWRQLIDTGYLKTEHKFLAKAADGSLLHSRLCSELSDEELAGQETLAV